MATAAKTPPASRIIIEPLNIEGKVLERGKTTAKNADEFNPKMDYAASRCPKLYAIKATMIEGQNVTIGFYTRAKGATDWTYHEQFPGNPPIPTPPADDATGPTKPKTSKRKKSTTPRPESSNGKPGVIAAIIELLKGSVDNGGMTVKEIVEALAKKFPSRDADSMEITVRCQLGRIPKQRNLKIEKQRIKDSKEVRYYIL